MNNIVFTYSFYSEFYAISLILSRRIIDGPLDVHPSRPAIVVHYEVEATVISEYGEPMVADKKQAKKM